MENSKLIVLQKTKTIQMTHYNTLYGILSDFDFRHFHSTSRPYIKEYNAHLSASTQPANRGPARPLFCSILCTLCLRFTGCVVTDRVLSDHCKWYQDVDVTESPLINKQWRHLLPSVLLPLPTDFCNFNFPRILTSLFRLFPLLR
jgi:hypothetical protein